jgi:uncharacterized repeat protein (TIGR03806 family)
MLRSVLLLAVAVFSVTAHAADDQPPYGIEHRVEWTGSRLVGSPEPPLPYTVEKTFANIAWKAPIYIADEPGTNHLLVVLQGGDKDRPSRILRVVDDPAATTTEVFFELPGRLVYAICFHPDYKTNRFVYLFHNGPTAEKERTNRVSRFQVNSDAQPTIDPKSEQVVIEWRSAGHDGGDLAFGNDGMLYIVTGDGTSDSDTWNSGQTLDDLLGSVLRIDVNRSEGQRNYAVPTDNPFVNTPGARGEIWAYGLRNPWRMSIDPPTGQVWVGNNGQDQWETAHLVRAGENYGWSVYEGSHPFYLERRRGPTPLVPPTIEHSHAEFRSLTGGVVYHGSCLAELEGAYIYGDYSSGRIWGMKHDGQRVVWHRELADTSLGITAFRVDQRGRLLVADLVGGIYELLPTPKRPPGPAFPNRLSDTGLFEKVAEHRVAPGVIPYSVNVPGWADGADAERFLALPGSAQIKYDSAKSWELPDGSALVQTLSIERTAGEPTSKRRIETRVLLRQQGEWAGYSYRWNEDQTDAELIPKEGADHPLPWRFPSRAECMMCHSRAANFVLGLSESQLNRAHDYGAVKDNQLRTLEHLGLFQTALPKPPAELARLPDANDSTGDLESRSRAYLHVNCAGCHVMAGGGNSQMELPIATAREKMNLLGARPQHDSFGIPNAMLVAPGDSDRSVVIHRLSRRGPGQMPPLVSRRVDQQGVELLRQWIAQLKPERPIVRNWTMDDLVPAMDELSAGRSLTAGRAAFRETGCAQCHRFEGEGGSVGPDLAGVAKRLAPRELLESILIPSKVIAEPYVTFAVETAEGKVVSGRIEREDGGLLIVRPIDANEKLVEIPTLDVVERRRLDRSNMPTGMVDVLQKEQVLDLLAYLLNDGKPSPNESP